MARDLKLNVWQHTPKQLAAKCRKVQGTLDMAAEHLPHLVEAYDGGAAAE